MLMKRELLVLSIFLAIALQISAQTTVFVNADGVTDPYKMLNSKGWYAEETTLHPGVKHITQIWDNDLGKYVFVFAMHRDTDGDGSERIDRQRLEIKTYGPSPENMKGNYGDVHTYDWKFKLDSGFQPSPNFCHIHQIKAGDGNDAGSPLMTITPRYGNPDKLQLIYTAPSAYGGTSTHLKEVDLAPFKGNWVEVNEKVKYADNGTYAITIKSVKDGAVLLSFSTENINMWRGTATFIRPKFGIYRSINSISYLRDEQVRFADFTLTEEASVSTSVGQLPVNSVEFNAYQEYDGVKCSYLLNKTSQVRLLIYDLSGRPLKTLVSGEQEPGSYTKMWDINPIPEGFYLAYLQVDNKIHTIKVMVNHGIK
ncbi:MAG TPA: hypothetical protein VIH57_14775 [Bacteroidales bacterium]